MYLKWQRKEVNKLIEEAILETELSGAKVLSLGLLNQEEELNAYEQLYIHKFPELKIKVIDGSSLATAIVLNTIPKSTTEVLMRGNFNKVSFAISNALSKRNVHIWLVVDGWDEEDQMKAAKGSVFIPFSQFPPKKKRTDCFYHYTPAMMAPPLFTNMHSCENWLPRRAMSAWRIAGIVHALEGWDVHECGSTTIDITQIWHATNRHGFKPLDSPF